MAKKVSDVSIAIDEVALSVLGWEVDEARLTSKTSEWSKGAENHLTISLTLRFSQEDWTDPQTSFQHTAHCGYCHLEQSGALPILVSFDSVDIPVSSGAIRLQEKGNIDSSCKTIISGDDLLSYPLGLR